MVRNRSSVSIPRRGSRRGSNKFIRVENWTDCETWVVNAYSGAAVQFPSSDEWLAAKIDKALNNGRAWRDFARLNERLRTDLMRFLNDQKNGWSLVLIDTQNFLGIRGLRSIRNDKWVRFIISPPRSVRKIIEIEDDINTHVPTAHDATLVLDKGHNVEGERTRSRGEDDNVAQGGSGALERRAGDDGPLPPQPTSIPYNYGPPPPQPTFNPYNYGPPPPQPTFYPYDYGPPPPPDLIAPPRRDLPNESSRRTGSPTREVGAKLGSVGQDSAPHGYPSEPIWLVDPDDSNMERALVRRHGGSPRVESYMREPILNDSIRVRGEDVGGTTVVVDGRTERLSTLETTRPQDQTRRHKVPTQHRLHRDKYETGEEEDYVPNSNPPRHVGSGAKLTDEEVILKTLRRFTTFQDDVNPSSSDDIAISSASTTSSLGRREPTVESRRASNDTMRSSWPAAAKERHGRIRDVSPAATATLEKEQKRPREQNREQVPTTVSWFTSPFRRFPPRPLAMTGQDEPVDVLESNAAEPSNNLAHESSAVNSASVHHDTGTDSVSGPEPNDEITSQSHRRARFQEDEGLARDTGKNPIKRSATEPISKAKPSISRSATVEDFEPEGEDRWTGGGAERWLDPFRATEHLDSVRSNKKTADLKR